MLPEAGHPQDVRGHAVVASTVEQRVQPVPDHRPRWLASSRAIRARGSAARAGGLPGDLAELDVALHLARRAVDGEPARAQTERGEPLKDVGDFPWGEPMLRQFGDRLVGQRETFLRQGENVIDQAGIAGFAIQQGLKVGFEVLGPFPGEVRDHLQRPGPANQFLQVRRPVKQHLSVLALVRQRERHPGIAQRGGEDRGRLRDRDRDLVHVRGRALQAQPVAGKPRVVHEQLGDRGAAGHGERAQAGQAYLYPAAQAQPEGHGRRGTDHCPPGKDLGQLPGFPAVAARITAPRRGVKPGSAVGAVPGSGSVPRDPGAACS